MYIVYIFSLYCSISFSCKINSSIVIVCSCCHVPGCYHVMPRWCSFEEVYHIMKRLNKSDQKDTQLGDTLGI